MAFRFSKPPALDFKDIIALVALLGLTAVFYLPEDRPLFSRYVCVAEPFERAAYILNDQYTDLFHHNDWVWEQISPFATLVARASLYAFSEDPGAAVVLMHMSIVFTSLIALFFACRLFLPLIPTFFVVSLVYFDRVLLPITRGLGITTIHLLLPLSLFLLYSLRGVLSPSLSPRQKTKWVLLFGFTGGWIYILGSHETFFAWYCFLFASAVWAARWLWLSYKNKRLSPVPPPALFAGLFCAFVFASIIIAIVSFGIPQQQHPTGFWSVLSYDLFFHRAHVDVSTESHNPLAFRLAYILRATFVEGRYLTWYGMWHENTFLFPGKGFNGVLPLFVFPGLLVGLPLFFWKMLLFFRPGHPRVYDPPQHFRLFLLLLLSLFLVVLVSSSDPKPTRYTFSVFAIYVIAIEGYKWLAHWLGEKLSRPGQPREANPAGGDSGRRLRAGRGAMAVIFLLLFYLWGNRIAKNFDDLQQYFVQYAHQIPTKAFAPAWKMAQEMAQRTDVVIMCPKKLFHNPAVGMLVRFQVPHRIHVVHNPRELKQLKLRRPEEVPVIPLFPKRAYHSYWDTRDYSRRHEYK